MPALTFFFSAQKQQCYFLDVLVVLGGIPSLLYVRCHTKFPKFTCVQSEVAYGVVWMFHSYVSSGVLELLVPYDQWNSLHKMLLCHDFLYFCLFPQPAHTGYDSRTLISSCQKISPRTWDTLVCPTVQFLPPDRSQFLLTAELHVPCSLVQCVVFGACDCCKPRARISLCGTSRY